MSVDDKTPDGCLIMRLVPYAASISAGGAVSTSETLVFEEISVMERCCPTHLWEHRLCQKSKVAQHLRPMPRIYETS